MMIPGGATTQSSGSCGSSAPAVFRKLGLVVGPGGGAEASTDQTSCNDWFQNSSDQKAYEFERSLPMNIVRARPVSRSIQSGGSGSNERWNFAGETAWFAAEISPVRF